MHELDHNLLAAWNRVFEKCKADPAEARRRYERTLPGATLDRPVRAWCVAIRASDTRLVQEVERGESGNGGVSQALKWWMSDRPLADYWADDDPICAQAAHEIVLDGVGLQQLGGAVDLPYPGVPIDEAAQRLGKHKEAVRRWLAARPGRTRAARAQSARGVGYDDDTLAFQEHAPTADRPLGVRYVPQRILDRGDRGGGMETPMVWSDGPLDPGAVKGRPPARWWGTLWMSMADKIPAEFEQVVERVPRFVPYPEMDGVNRPRFRGWWWVCPGLLGKRVGNRASGIDERQDDFKGCGRLVQTLYAPLPVWTIGRYWGIKEGLEVAGLAGQWYPGVMDRWAGRRTLACEHCWKLRRTSFAGYRGWNALVTHLSGGLLFGHEVTKPADFEYERRRKYMKRKRKQNGKVGGGLRAGVTPTRDAQG